MQAVSDNRIPGTCPITDNLSMMPESVGRLFQSRKEGLYCHFADSVLEMEYEVLTIFDKFYLKISKFNPDPELC